MRTGRAAGEHATPGFAPLLAGVAQREGARANSERGGVNSMVRAVNDADRLRALGVREQVEVCKQGRQRALLADLIVPYPHPGGGGPGVISAASAQAPANDRRHPLGRDVAFDRVKV